MPFPLVSGHLSLDLVNTEVVKRGIRQNLLISEGELVDWINTMQNAGNLFNGQFDIESVLADGLYPVLVLRQFLRSGFEKIAEGEQVSDDWLSYLENLNKRAPFTYKLISNKLVPIPVGHPVDAIISLVAFDALQLHASGDLKNLRRCNNPDCVLLFMDTSDRRKWCSMKICGNRTKVARHQKRQEEKQSK
ncbi:CGNR zinc finger domain-containing protein [Risungbinella massiliensis]|uniref:CGNR zinc finger domain-containing protein n=1 Tax=Risungbinella massiliensis TaxID=1329796 RepID=UPI000A9E0694